MPILQRLKRKVLGGYVRGLERVDPKFAEHVLTAQGEFFSAAKAFFEAEEQHARKAASKVRERAAEAGSRGDAT